MLDYAIASVPWPSIIICIITPLLEGTLKLVLLYFSSFFVFIRCVRAGLDDGSWLSGALL